MRLFLLGSFLVEKQLRKSQNNMGNDTMKEEYDFSKGERGKFFQKDIKLNLPVYLEGEIMEFVEKIAKKKNVDVSTIVNQLLRRDMQLSDVMQ